MVGKSKKPSSAASESRTLHLVGHSKPLGPYQESAWCARSNVEPRWGKVRAPSRMEIAMIAMRRCKLKGHELKSWKSNFDLCCYQGI
jgi:hypothetical protein